MGPGGLPDEVRHTAGRPHQLPCFLAFGSCLQPPTENEPAGLADHGVGRGKERRPSEGVTARPALRKVATPY